MCKDPTQNGRMIMTKIAGNILELIGNTPLVKLNKLNGSKAEVLLKLE